MATSVAHRHVNLTDDPLALLESFESIPLEYDRHHDVLYDPSTESSSQLSIMSAEDIPLDLSRTLTTGSEGWTDSEDDNDDSSVTSDTSHARIARRPHFPPVLPSVNSSSSISKSLPQKLAATIAAAEGSNLDRRRHHLSKSHSPSARFRRVKSPSIPSQTHRRSLISDALRANFPLDSQNRPNHLQVPPTRHTRQFSHGIHDNITERAGLPGVKGPRPKPYSWKGLGVESVESEESDYEEDETRFANSSEDEDDEEDNVSARASRGLQRLAEHYSRLRGRRTNLWETFDNIHLKRAQVQDLRHVKDETTLAFMTAVQAILPNNPELDHLFKDMQDAQLRCQEAEQRFDDMLDELQHGEVELELEEQRFYTAAAGGDGTDNESDDDSCSVTSEVSALLGITGDRPEDIHPLFEELREASRNIQLAKELLVNTQMKRKALSAGKSHLLSPDSIDLLEKYGDAGKNRALELKRSGVMSEDDIEMLMDYDKLEQKARLDIDRFTKDVIRLESECREKGVMPKNTPFQEAGFGVNPVLKDDIQLDDVPFETHARGQPKTLAHSIFPKLLSNPTHLLEAFPMTAQQSLRLALSLPPAMPSRQKHVNDAAREVNIQSLLVEAGDVDKRGYINRWLLHKLHLSPMEAELLWSTFHVCLRVRDTNRWQQDVLHLWWKDQAANLPPAQFESTHEDRSTASINPRTDLPARRFSDSGQLDHLRLWEIEDAWG